MNRAGISFSSNLVDERLTAGIEPYHTVYHWDLPQSLQGIGVWMNPDMLRYFEEHSRAMFEALKGRVRKWITLNEPNTVASKGSRGGGHAPA